jgi:predicted nucleic acid-binding protein
VTYWFDSSALVKRYVQETGTAWVQALFGRGDDICIAALAGVELIAALTRRANRGEITATDLATAVGAYRADGADYWVAAVDPLLVLAEALAARHGLRAYDAVQLAGALEVRRRLQTTAAPGPTFVSSDYQLLVAAGVEGLLVEDPLSHP